MEWLDAYRSGLPILPIHCWSVAGLLFRIPAPPRRFEDSASTPCGSPRCRYLRDWTCDELQPGSAVSGEFPWITHSRSSATDRSLLPGNIHSVFVCPASESGSYRCRATRRILGAHALCAGAWFRSSWARHSFSSSRRQSRRLSGSQVPHHSLGEDSRSRGTAEHSAGHCDAAPRSFHWRMAAVKTRAPDQGSRHVALRRGWFDSWQDLGNLVPHQQETLDQFLCACQRRAGVDLPGPLLLGNGYQALARSLDEAVSHFRQECDRGLHHRLVLCRCSVRFQPACEWEDREQSRLHIPAILCPVRKSKFRFAAILPDFCPALPAPNLADGSQEDIPEDLTIDNLPPSEIGTLTLQTAELHPTLKNQDCRHPIHCLATLFNREIGVAQQAVGFGGGQALVPKMDRQTETLAQFFGEKVHLVGLNSLGAAHAQGKPNYDLLYFMLTNHSLQVVEVIPFVSALHCFQALGGDPQRIRYRDTDPSRPHVEAQNSANRSGTNLGRIT